jgi:predicted negative regulator of RcsB-dependent stress response
MVDLMTEEEQIIAIKTWWKRYGVVIIGGVAIGLAAYFAWTMWQTHNENMRAQDSLNYETIVDNLNTGKNAAADQQIINDANAQLAAPYNILEQMLLSEVEVNQQDLDKAMANLHQALSLSTDPFFRELSSVRLARLYLAQGKAQEALEMVTLKNDKDASKNPDVFVARGDAYVALQDTEKAREAYTTAWQLAPTYSPERQIIALLLAELPEELPEVPAQLATSEVVPAVAK